MVARSALRPSRFLKNAVIAEQLRSRNALDCVPLLDCTKTLIALLMRRTNLL
jgi:hypothetical protein